jgi:predicted transcriptional regulator
MQRETNESLFNYAKRLLANDDLDRSEIYELIFGEHVAYDTARKQLRGIQSFLELLSEDEIKDISDETLLEKIRKEREGLKKERIKLQTESTLYNQNLRLDARKELLDEKIIEAIKSVKIDVPAIPIAKLISSPVESALCFADAHVGTEFIIYDLCHNIINKYNNDIFEDRMWNLLYETVDFIRSNGLQKIKIFDLGDCIEGLLHFSQLMNLKYGAVESAVYYGKFLLTWLAELEKATQIIIEVGEVDGNHTETRPLTGKKNDFRNENLSIVIRTMIEIGIQQIPNMYLMPCTSTGSVYTKIAGFDILALHGQDEKGRLENAFKEYSLFYSNNNIDYLIAAHLHFDSSTGIGYKKGVVQIPSIVGCGEFSESIKKISAPGATLLTFEENKGLTDEHHIIL